MKTSVLFSFTEKGRITSERIASAISSKYKSTVLEPRGNLKSLVEEHFSSADALIFVGACGIAVRAIAPHIVSKTSDPAVISVDECARFVIPILSGHIGGANELAVMIAKAVDGVAVVTTATDINNRFSVDNWARSTGLIISSMEIAKRFSAEILKRDLPLYTDVEIKGSFPPGIYPGDSGDLGAAVTYRDSTPFETTLRLIPRVLHVGVGCRRGTGSEKIRDSIQRVFTENSIRTEAISCLASIDVKRDEAGLITASEAFGSDIHFFTAAELEAARGNFTASDFVKSAVGVDNVCERAAICSAGTDATLIVKKNGRDGVTVAVAAEKRRYSFE